MRSDVDTYYIVLDAGNCDRRNVTIDYLKWEGLLYIILN